MSADCADQSCGWSGTSSDVADAHGCCKRCGGPVRYNFAPLVNAEITKTCQFNRRAVTALKGCSLNQWDAGFILSILLRVEHYEALEKSEQMNLIRAVLRHSREIADRPVVAWAEIKSPKVTA